MRQRPKTTKGTVFISLEDETGTSNAILYPASFEQMRLTISQKAFLLIEGRVQITEGTVHVRASRIEGMTNGSAHAPSHDFHYYTYYLAWRKYVYGTGLFDSQSHLPGRI